MTASELQDLINRRRLYFDPNSSAINTYNEYLKLLAERESKTVRPIYLKRRKRTNYEIDIVDFVENVLGIELLHYQKVFLRMNTSQQEKSQNIVVEQKMKKGGDTD